MEGGNKILNTFVLIATGIFVAMSLIICMSLSVRAGLAPMGAALREVISMQRQLDDKITNGVVAENAALSERITALENQLKAMQAGGAPAGFPNVAGARQMPQPQQPPEEDLNKVYDLPIDGSYILGKPDAKVTFVEFSDFQCPFCARFHPVLTEVQKVFPNDVKLVIKNFPLSFHQNARPAAKAALAAGLQGKYFEMVSAVLENAQNLSDDKYKELAGKIGLNVAKFTQDLKDKDAEFEKKLQADIALGQKADVRGTPSYYINGKKSQARDIEGWKAEVQALLKN
jgi:protein-disulfide isomerase